MYVIRLKELMFLQKYLMTESELYDEIGQFFKKISSAINTYEFMNQEGKAPYGNMINFFGYFN